MRDAPTRGLSNRGVRSVSPRHNIRRPQSAFLAAKQQQLPPAPVRALPCRVSNRDYFYLCESSTFEHPPHLHHRQLTNALTASLSFCSLHHLSGSTDLVSIQIPELRPLSVIHQSKYPVKMKLSTVITAAFVLVSSVMGQGSESDRGAFL